MKKPLIAAVLAAALGSIPAFSAEQSGTANVEIVSAVSITEETEVDFGTVVNVNGRCTMASGGALSGTTGMACTGNETPGVFRVDGTVNAYVQASVSPGPSVDGVSFIPKIDGQTIRILSKGDAHFPVIGEIVLDDATDGDKDIPYVFTAHYQ